MRTITAITLACAFALAFCFSCSIEDAEPSGGASSESSEAECDGPCSSEPDEDVFRTICNLNPNDGHAQWYCGEVGWACVDDPGQGCQNGRCADVLIGGTASAVPAGGCAAGQEKVKACKDISGNSVGFTLIAGGGCGWANAVVSCAGGFLDCAGGYCQWGAGSEGGPDGCAACGCDCSC